MPDPDLWFPGARLNQLAPVDGGSILGGKPKLLWHDTESSAFPSYSTGFWPHMTINPTTGEARQHIPANRACRALRNESGGVQTNRWRVFQIEVLGFANEVAFHPVMAEVATWAHDRLGVPRTESVDWLAYPASFGQTNVRLSDAEWSGYAGHLAHMHAPENCVTPDTLIFCADLGWRPAGDLRVGDRIIAFDETGEPMPNQRARRIRRFRTATITRNDPGRKQCAVVRTDKAEIIASVDHPWLVRRPIGSRGRMLFGWDRTDALQPGDLLAWFAEPWQPEATWEAGWLAGMFDADGWLSTTRMSNGAYLGIGQADGATQERVVDAFQRRGYRPTIVHREGHQGWNKSPFAQISIWGMRDQLRCLGTIRPPRFMDRELSVLWEGRQVRHEASIDAVEVRQVQTIGEQEIASITTSTGTFITGGFLTHNSHGDPGWPFPISQILQGEDMALSDEDKQWLQDDLIRLVRLFTSGDQGNSHYPATDPVVVPVLVAPSTTDLGNDLAAVKQQLIDLKVAVDNIAAGGPPSGYHGTVELVPNP